MELTTKKAIVILLFSAFILYFSTIFCHGLRSGDETRVAGIAAEMALTGNFITPKLNGTPFLEYPPMFYWFTAISFKLFGINEFAAKLGPALLGIFAVLLQFLFARKMKMNIYASLFSAIVLLTGTEFFTYSRICMVDIGLAFSFLVTCYAFAGYCGGQNKKQKILWTSLISAGLTCGVMTKGVIGLGLPLSGIGIYCIVSDILDKKFRFDRYFSLGCAFAFSLIIFAGWGYLLYLQEGPQAVHTVFIVNNIGRFSGSQGDHVVPWYYYFKKLPEIFQPWIFFLIAEFVVLCIKDSKQQFREKLFPLCILLVPFLFLTISASKRQLYLLPLAIPASLLVGWLYTYIKPEKYKSVFRMSIMAFLIGGLIVGSVIVYRTNKKDNVRPMYEAVQKSGLKLILINPPERTSGAAVFYLGKNVSQKRLQSDKIRKGPEKGTCWILRDRAKQFQGRRFADDHLLILPE